MDENKLYIGLDLSPEYTQLSYYKEDIGEPESIYHNDSKDTYLLPNIMFYSVNDKNMESDLPKKYAGWCVGSKASARRFKEDGILVDRLYQKVMDNEEVEIYDRTYQAKELLVMMLVLHIRQFTERVPERQLERLVVTIADTDILLIKAVRGLMKELKLTEERFEIVSHLDSGLYYIFNQPESLRNNSVLLFDFNNGGMESYRIDITRNKTPEMIDVVYQDLKKRINYSVFRRDKEDLDDLFTEVAKEALSEVYVSSVFLTGIGFSDNWMKRSAAVLCQGRRVFVGQNIYTKGACYRAYGGMHAAVLGKYIRKTKYTVRTDIGISLMDEKDTFYPIAQAGEEWFNTRGKLYIFPDETNRLELIYRDVLTGESEREHIEIHGLPVRPPRTTKLSLEVEFYSADKGAVVIRDEGFGSLFPSTNKIYRKEFSLNSEKEKERDIRDE